MAQDDNLSDKQVGIFKKMDQHFLDWLDTQVEGPAFWEIENPLDGKVLTPDELWDRYNSGELAEDEVIAPQSVPSSNLVDLVLEKPGILGDPIGALLAGSDNGKKNRLVARRLKKKIGYHNKRTEDSPGAYRFDKRVLDTNEDVIDAMVAIADGVKPFRYFRFTSNALPFVKLLEDIEEERRNYKGISPIVFEKNQVPPINGYGIEVLERIGLQVDSISALEDAMWDVAHYRKDPEEFDPDIDVSILLRGFDKYRRMFNGKNGYDGPGLGSVKGLLETVRELDGPDMKGVDFVKNWVDMLGDFAAYLTFNPKTPGDHKKLNKMAEEIGISMEQNLDYCKDCYINRPPARNAITQPTMPQQKSYPTTARDPAPQLAPKKYDGTILAK